MRINVFSILYEKIDIKISEYIYNNEYQKIATHDMNIDIYNNDDSSKV